MTTSWHGLAPAIVLKNTLSGMSPFPKILIQLFSKSIKHALTGTQRANSGDGKAGFKQINNLTPDINCKSATGVNFIDMNGDGFDDLVYIDEDGNAYLSINQGDGDRAAGKAPTFKRVSDTAKIKTTEGYGREKVRLADIDGDGRGDYGVWDGSSWKFWRNGGVGNIPEYWQALGARRKDEGYGSYEGYIFEDVNGDVSS